MPGAVFFRALDSLPVRPNLLDVADFGIAKDMRMAADQLIGDMPGDLIKVKSAAFFGELAMKDHLQ